MNSHTGDNTRIGDGRGSLGPVSPGNKSGLLEKVFHLHVKDHVAGYFLIANRRRLPIDEEFESNADVFHFLGNCVSPEGIAILFVKLESFFDSLRHLDAKFMGPFEVSRITLLHKRNDPVSLFENMGHPPVESWFVVNAKYFNIFSNLNRMRFL